LKFGCEHLEACSYVPDWRDGFGSIVADAEIGLIACGDRKDFDVGPWFTVAADVQGRVFVAAA